MWYAGKVTGSRPMRVLTWNLEFGRSGTARARLTDTEIARHSPDVICLTETHLDRLPEDDHTIWADPAYGYPAPADRRKVGLWSRYGWADVDLLGDPDLPGGRFVAGTTTTPLGAVRVIGVCIPWRMAHVSTGRRDRVPWEDHLRYLQALAGVVANPTDGHLVVVGDFNQRLSGRWGSAEAAAALRRTFTGMAIATSDPVPGLDRELIDHVAHSDGLVATRVTGISRVQDAVTVSDHDGVVVDLETR